jgi:hypothetical protein
MRALEISWLESKGVAKASLQAYIQRGCEDIPYEIEIRPERAVENLLGRHTMFDDNREIAYHDAALVARFERAQQLRARGFSLKQCSICGFGEMAVFPGNIVADHIDPSDYSGATFCDAGQLTAYLRVGG